MRAMKMNPLCLLALLAAKTLHAAEPPDYKLWQDLLTKYYDPAKGMSYKSLKEHDKATLDKLRQQLAAVDVSALAKPDQLAYWINLYNISTLAVVIDGYPTKSIRDLSTDPIIRLNVFKKPSVKTKAGAIALNDVENDKIREGFKDPRIHFAINCAAKSCPPIRTEPYIGARLGEQLDDQARRSSTVRMAPACKGRQRRHPARHQDHGLVQGRLRQVGRRPGGFPAKAICRRTSEDRSTRPRARSISHSTTTTGR